MSHRHALYALLLVMLLACPLLAADNAYQVSITRASTSNTLTLTFWIGNASPEFVLGTAGFKLSYNNLALGCPTKVLAEDGPWDQQTDPDYANMTLTLHDYGVVELHTQFIGGGNYSGPMVPAGRLTKLGAIRFEILDASASAALAWAQPYVFRLNSPGSQPSYEVLYTFAGDFIPPDDVPLPITLSSFTGVPVTDGIGVALTWRTLSEVNNYGFTVQRRSAGTGEFTAVSEAFLPGAGTTVEPRTYAFIDRTLSEPGNYEYRLMQQDLNGATWFSSALNVTVVLTALQDIEIPVDPTLVQNYPNPFNPETVIRYGVGERSPVSVEIFSVLGQKVRTLVNAVQESGKYAASWDGTDDQGRAITSGSYICRVTSATGTASVKMLLLR
jgi:hypothetical protein